MSNLHSAREEIIALRRALRQTKRALRSGAIDPLKANRMITQATRTLSSLLRLQRRLDYYTNQQALLHEFTKNIVGAARHPHKEPSAP